MKTIVTVFLLSLLLWLPRTTQAASIVVNTNSGQTVMDGNCSLPEAIQAANEDRPIDRCLAGSGYDVISFGADVRGIDILTPLQIRSNLLIAGNERMQLSGRNQSQIMLVSNGANVTINNVRVQQAMSDKTGGALIIQNGRVTLNNVTMLDNHAPAGAAIALLSGQLRVSGGRFVTNEATLGQGGAIYSTGESLSIDGVEFEGNIAHSDGGAIAATSGSLIITNSDFNSNVGNEGGAIHVSGNAQMNLRDSVFSDNRAETRPGGKFGDASGGAVAIENATRAQFLTNNRFIINIVQGSGGAISIATTPTFMDGNRFESNIAFVHGGGIYAIAVAQMNCMSCVWQFNQATVSNGVQPAQGGAVALARSRMTIGGGVMQNNSAEFGGAIALLNDSQLSLLGSEVSNNTATRSGAAIQLFRNSNLYGGWVNLRNNSAQESGGAIATFDSQVTLSESTIGANRAVGDGGGVYASGSRLRLGGIPVVGNRSTAGSGGGVYLLDSKLIYIGAEMVDNSAELNGGAIAAQSASQANTLLLEQVTLIGNRAVQNGGAIQTGMLTTLRNVTITSNSAQNGAGIYGNNAKVNIVHATIVRNNARGLAGSLPQAFIVNSIVAQNGGGDCEQPYMRMGGLANLDGDKSCGATISADPNIAPLQTTSFAWRVHPLKPFSPALDQGNSFFCLPTDQLSVTRSRPCDLGAVESQ